MARMLLLLAALPLAAADIIMLNGKILTADAQFHVAQALAIEGNRIVKVGRDRDMAILQKASTKMIDLQGKTVVPGLIDAHVHVLSAGLSEFREPLPPLNSYTAIRSYIRERASKTPKGEWIIVPRTFPTRLREMRMPTRDVLDATSDHPVMFDASYVWVVNSVALQMSGITRNTPNPPGGVIVKDANGEPNGILRNAGRLLKGINRAERVTDDEKLRAMEAMMKRYVAAGLTGVGDRAVGPEDVALYEKLVAAKRMPLRVALTWRLDASGSAEEAAARIRESPWSTGKGADPAWLKFATFKLTLDGGMTIGTAYQRHPYGEFGRQLYGMSDPDDRGQLFIPPAKLQSILAAARDKGWQLTAHSQGGGAVDTLLEAFEKLDTPAKPIRATRSHPMHASFQSPEAIAKMRRLGLPADVQAAWLYLDGPALSRVFPNGGLKHFFPLKMYRDNGIVLAGGSDHMIGFDKNKAVNPYNPFLGMWTAVTRKMANGETLHPEQCISREEALRMYTSGAAWIQFEEKSRGSIEAGKLADLVILDRDYMAVPADEIRNIEPVMTMIDGKIAWQK